ncbi:MAG: hypothetical protein AAB261_01070 [Chloroflexota bacterium]
MSLSPSDLVLVALLPSQRDLEIARVLGWYRIPYKTAPKTVSVDALAFYQTANFGDEKWSIHYVAPVVGHELTTRAELLRTEKDHPRANEQYFKIQIGSLERLAKPIPSRSWRRITFFYTTGERLLNANEINDLIVDSEERELLWTALKERGLTAERKYEVKRGVEVDFALLCQLGVLGIVLGDKVIKERAGEKYLILPEVAVQENLPSVMKAIAKEVKGLGGLRKKKR